MAQTLGSVAVGSIVKLNENGSPVNYIVVHQGLPSAMYDASCDGTWLLRQDIWKNGVWNSSNVNTLAGSTIMTTMAGFLGRLDSDMQNAVKTVKIPYCVGNGSATVNSGANGLECKVFPLGVYEVGWTTSNDSDYPADGAKLDYFIAGKGSSANNKRVAKLNGKNSDQWTRSSYNINGYMVVRVDSGGDSLSSDANNSYGLRPTLILQKTIFVLDDGTVSVEAPAPSAIDVPIQAMQGNQLSVSWSAVDGADGYILERKANTDSDWTQVYSGANTSFEETVGTWTSVQYRVKAGVSGTYGDYTTSASVSVVSASAVVISGTDGDLGTLVNDVSYTVSSDGSTELTVTETINGTETRTFTATNGGTNKIPVVDLPTGYGTIKITASTNPGSGVVSVERNWTYSKAAITFPDAGGVADLIQNGQTIWAKTIAEAVRTPGIWGGNLGLALSLLSNAALYNQEAKNVYEEVTVSLADKAEGQIIQLPEDGHMVEFYVAKINYEPELNGAGRLLLVRKNRHSNRQWNLTGALTWEDSSLLTWYNSTYKSLFPEEVQTAMGTTTYRFTKGDTGAVATRADSVFALSLTELGETGLVVNIEGSKLPISDMLQVMEGDAYGTQWTRSFDPEDDETGARYISATGAPGATLASSVQGARPVFTLPSTFSQTYFVDAGGNIGEQQEILEAGSWSDIYGNAIPAVKIETGSYTGTGTYGQNNPTTLTFGFNVKLVIITGRWGSSSVVKDDFSLILNKEAGGYFGSLGSNTFNGEIVQSDEKTLKLYNTTSAANQMNANGVTYHYIGIGLSGGESA